MTNRAERILRIVAVVALVQGIGHGAMFAAIATRNAALVHHIVGLFLIANVAQIAILARCFAFPLPMVFDALIAAGLGGMLIVG